MSYAAFVTKEVEDNFGEVDRRRKQVGLIGEFYRAFGEMFKCASSDAVDDADIPGEAEG